jgi:hypothetical protein
MLPASSAMLKPTTITTPVSLWLSTRYYSSEIGWWMLVDPMAYKYPGSSPYNYATCNPLRFIDADRRDWYEDRQ